MGKTEDAFHETVNNTLDEIVKVAKTAVGQFTKILSVFLEERLDDMKDAVKDIIDDIGDDKEVEDDEEDLENEGR